MSENTVIPHENADLLTKAVVAHHKPEDQRVVGSIRPTAVSATAA